MGKIKVGVSPTNLISVYFYWKKNYNNLVW